MSSPQRANMLRFTFHKSVEQEVEIRICTDSGSTLQTVLSKIEPDKVFIISDAKVDKLYADELIAALSETVPLHRITHQPDEAHKTLEAINAISNEFFRLGGTNKSCIVALGGGVTGNMAGLFATIAFRGLPLIHIPTTLLAQLDSAADVKQSVNAGHVKNSVGTYKAPHAVIINPNYLASLSDRELRSGLGEAIKHGFAQDIEFVERITKGKTRDIAFLADTITAAIGLKIDHWNNTPTIWNDKKKVERLTHLGHTTGKILEMIEVDHLTHGEAIAHGMVIEAYASHLTGHLPRDAVDYIESKLESLDLLYPLGSQYTEQTILAGLYPKKNSEPLYALLENLGDSKTISTTLPKSTMKQAISFHLDLLRSKGLLKQK